VQDSDGKKTKEPNAALTRREALLTIGGAALLYSLPHPALADATTASVGDALPPGLYTPSLDHLTHAINSNQRFVRVPAGTQTEYLQPTSTPFVPQALAPNEFALIRRLVEIIIGEDVQDGAADTSHDIAEWIDTVVATAPAVRTAAHSLSAEHRALAVAYFGNEESVSRLETFAPEQICREGLGWIEQQSQRRFGKPFLEAEKASQVDLLQRISELPSDASSDLAGRHFFDFLKEECVRGFYTSQRGLKELDFKGNAFYSHSPGCSLTPKS